jgi:hypothetical protein
VLEERTAEVKAMGREGDMRQGMERLRGGNGGKRGACGLDKNCPRG